MRKHFEYVGVLNEVGTRIADTPYSGIAIANEPQDMQPEIMVAGMDDDDIADLAAGIYGRVRITIELLEGDE